MHATHCSVSCAAALTRFFLRWCVVCAVRGRGASCVCNGFRAVACRLSLAAPLPPVVGCRCHALLPPLPACLARSSPSPRRGACMAAARALPTARCRTSARRGALPGRESGGVGWRGGARLAARGGMWHKVTPAPWRRQGGGGSGGTQLLLAAVPGTPARAWSCKGRAAAMARAHPFSRLRSFFASLPPRAARG